MSKGGVAAYESTAPAQVSTSGEGIAYMSNSAFPGALGNTALLAAHVSTRFPSGWTTAEWTPQILRAAALKGYLATYEFSADLSQGFLQVPLMQLTEDATPYVTNLYQRHVDGTYSVINAAKPTTSVEELCGPGLLSVCWEVADGSAFAGASSDFKHVAFESNAQLTPEAPGGSNLGSLRESLYENRAGQVKLIGILPDGNPATSSTAGAGTSAFYPISVQESQKRAEHAMSLDGSHVVFQAPSDGGTPVLGGTPIPAQNELLEVYDRIGGSETLELSAPAPGATPANGTAEPATFWAASADGSRVFFTSAAELTTQSNTGTANDGEDLYEYYFELGRETGHLTDLTIDTSPEDVENGAAVQGVVDVSADGSYVYFVAHGVLDAGKGVAGQPNLYVVHDGGKPTFIATLKSGICSRSENKSSDSCDWSPIPAELEAYVTPDGKHLAFMSTASLSTANYPTGYDNIDPVTSEADSEVYEYSVSSGEEAGGLVCASCEPQGAPPTGNALLGGMANAALVPEPGAQKYQGVSTPFYRVRSVSDNGARVFYTAPASQVAPFERVQEYERDGEGTCTTEGGCQYLLSSSGGESDQFLGASAGGGDVFFSTADPLASTDTDKLTDVYDARVGGGFPVPTEARCQADCRQASVAPAIQPPTSVAVGAPGNLPAPTHANAAPKRKCRKHRKTRHGKCVPAKRGKATRKARKTNTERGTQR